MQTLSPCLAAGLLLAAIPVLKHVGLAAPSATEILKEFGATRTTSYRVKGDIESMLPNLLRQTGRPARPEPAVDLRLEATLLRRVLDFVFDHPGCVGGSSRRRSYGSVYHRFVLDLWEEGGVSVEVLSMTTGVPVGTLKGWFRGECPEVVMSSSGKIRPSTSKIETVVSEYSHWKGGFGSFCNHIQFNLRIAFGCRYIDDILKGHGLRQPTSRGRPRDASASSKGFETFFPNAQWVGDGCELTVGVAEESFKVNLELLVDAESAAFVGASIRPTEDATAVIEAFKDGVNTTGRAPLAVLLDNKPSNHAKAVEEALGDAFLMRSRPYVPTDKPQVEGAFGLFMQEAPALVIHGATPRQISMEVARLVTTTWLRAVNHRPRADRKGKSRVALFGQAQPTESEIEAAKAALTARDRRQRRARETRRRRQDPLAHARLNDAFRRLELEDPQRHLRIAIASWPLPAIIEGIAIFEGKKRVGTLPAGVDGRYLRGIVKNIAEEREGMAIAEALLRERIATRDLALEHLGAQRSTVDDESPDVGCLIKAYVTKAMGACRGIDRTFWLLATSDAIRAEPGGMHRTLARLAARRIHATYAVPHKERLAATRLLFAKLFPVD